MGYCVRSRMPKVRFCVRIFNCCTAPGKNLSVGPPVTLFKECPWTFYLIARVRNKNEDKFYFLFEQEWSKLKKFNTQIEILHYLRTHGNCQIITDFS